MKVPSQHYIGVAVGAAVFVLVANVLNTFYGLEIQAILIGLLAGIESGFLVGSFGESKAIYERFGSTLLAISIGSFIYRKAIPRILTGVSFITAFFLAIWSTQFVAGHGFLTFLKFEPHNKDNLQGWLLCALFFTLMSQIMIDSGQDHVNGKSSLREQYESGGIKIIGSIFVGLLAPILMWVYLFVFASLIAILTVFAPLKILSISMRRNTTIPFGVIAGGFSGLIYGWTHLDFTMTSLAVTTASFVGMVSAWLIIKAEATINKWTEAVGEFVPGYDGPGDDDMD